MLRTPATIRLAITLTALGAALASRPAGADDTQLWNEFIVDVMPAHNCTLEFVSEQDLVEDLGRLGLWNLTIEPSYSPTPWLALGVGYRNEHTEKEHDWRTENRYWLHAGVKHKAGGWTLAFRPKLEFRDREENDAWRFRAKVKVQHPARLGALDFTPYWSDEALYDTRSGQWNQNRMAVGLRLPVVRHLQLGGYYMHVASKYGDEWDSTHVVGTELLAAF